MRNPYVGEGADGARRSAEIDRSEADGLDPGPYRDAVLASAAAWLEQAEQLEAAEVVEGELVDSSGDPWVPPAEPAPAPDEEVVLTRDQAAQRLVTIAALEQLVRKLKAEHRAEAAGVYDRPHMKDPVELDGRELGQVRTDAVTAAWKVADEAAWATYAAKVYDDAMVEQVTTVLDPELTKRALAGLTSGDWVTLDPGTGEVVDGPPPGLEYTPAGHKLVVVPAKDAGVRVAQLLGPVAGKLGLPELEADR